MRLLLWGLLSVASLLAVSSDAWTGAPSGTGGVNPTRRVTCRSQSHCGCDVEVVITVLGECPSGEVELGIHVTVRCGEGNTCSEDFERCWSDGTPVTLQCNETTFSLQPHGTVGATWGGSVFGPGSCGNIGLRCGSSK